MPARPLPQHHERAQPHKAPQRTREAGEHRREVKFYRDARQLGDERVDGDVGERIGQPRELLKISGAGRRWPVLVGRQDRTIFVRRRHRQFFQPERQADLPGDDDGGNVKNAAVAEHFQQRAADEQRGGVGRRPSDVVDANAVRHAVGGLIFADERL